MPQLVTIFGGSGFVGRYIAQQMAKEGWRVRVAVRRPIEAVFVKTYGNVGQVEPVLANIRDDGSVLAALNGADAAINCVGVLAPNGKNTFDAVHDDGAQRVARLAAAAGVQRLVHISAIGADSHSDSDYAQSKAAGEAGVIAAFPDAVILRPSVIFGPEDDFFNRFARMSQFGPFLPIMGASTRFQPVYVGDVARAAVTAALGTAAPGTYELGGPDVDDFAGLMDRMLDVVQRRRIILNIPFAVGRIIAFSMDMVQAISLGLIRNPVITRDQLRNLQHDNVVSDGAMTLADLGIDATSMDTILPEYLWCFRPSGQYAAIKSSARNLRT